MAKSLDVEPMFIYLQFEVRIDISVCKHIYLQANNYSLGALHLILIDHNLSGMVFPCVILPYDIIFKRMLSYFEGLTFPSFSFFHLFGLQYVILYYFIQYIYIYISATTTEAVIYSILFLTYC